MKTRDMAPPCSRDLLERLSVRLKLSPSSETVTTTKNALVPEVGRRVEKQEGTNEGGSPIHHRWSHCAVYNVAKSVNSKDYNIKMQDQKLYARVSCYSQRFGCGDGLDPLVDCPSSFAHRMLDLGHI